MGNIVILTHHQGSQSADIPHCIPAMIECCVGREVEAGTAACFSFFFPSEACQQGYEQFAARALHKRSEFTEMVSRTQKDIVGAALVRDSVIWHHK